MKVKPGSKREGSGCLSVGVECYGGGIWASWFDRDLKIAGRALVKVKFIIEFFVPSCSDDVRTGLFLKSFLGQY